MCFVQEAPLQRTKQPSLFFQADYKCGGQSGQNLELVKQGSE